MSRVHFIAIGGSVMHNLALAMHEVGHRVSGSDDQIFEPARSRLEKVGLLPAQEGWFPEKLSDNIDFVILGMHAKKNNPELEQALKRGIPVYSFPEFIQKAYHDKFQIVVTGSHGKTTTTSMLMHIFKSLGLRFDYLVGSQLEGFKNMVSITDAPYAIIEGDEYLSSCLDPSPKFMHYLPSILIITGIAWDHFNVFPTFEQYLQAFRDRIALCRENAKLIYFKEDEHLQSMIANTTLQSIAYSAAPTVRVGNDVKLSCGEKQVSLSVFGKHNMENMQAAIEVTKILKLDQYLVCQALASFKGASKRLELIHSDAKHKVFRDFAHAPSKLQASLNALREHFPHAKIMAVAELHTYSSLNPDFLPQYQHTAQSTDYLMVYYDAHALQIKQMAAIQPEDIKRAFLHPYMEVFTDPGPLQTAIGLRIEEFDVVVFAGSGNFGKMDLKQWFD